MSSHIERVKRELSDAGVTWHGLLRAEARYLPSVIHNDEHVKAAVYGRTKDGSAMLVATDRRILFVDKKPMVTISDELSYEVVSGVGLTQEKGLTAGITLFTRIGNYTVRFANMKSVKKFEAYIESHRLEGKPKPDSRRTSPVFPSAKITNGVKLNKETTSFLNSHELGVLSTLDRNNQLHGAAVYYVFDEKEKTIHILTKSQTQKSHNILATHKVAFTVFDEEQLQTAQLQGIAEIEPDAQKKQDVFIAINRTRVHGKDVHHPPVTKLVEGHFIVYRITITSARYQDFKFHR